MLAALGTGALLLGLALPAALAPVAAAASTAPEPSPTSTAAPAPTPDPEETAPPSPSPSLEPAPEPAPSEAPAPPEDPEPTPTPTPTPTEPPPSPDSEPPVIATPSAGELTGEAFTASGTAAPGSTLQLLVGGSTEPACIVEIGSDGAWSCAVGPLETSPSTSLRAVQQPASGESLESATVVRVLGAPVATGGPRGTLTNGVVLGTAYPGATVTADADGATCTGTADAAGAWTCPLEGVTDGEHLLTATQSTSFSDGASSAPSAPVAITVDLGVPAAPVVSSPAEGARLPLTGASFAGSGETGATVSVFAGAQVLCETEVVAGSWSCTADVVEPGRYRLAVLQQDAAGNVSVQSGGIAVRFLAASATPPPASGTSRPTPAPSSSGSATPQQPGVQPGDPGALPGDGDGKGGDSGGGDPAATPPDAGDAAGAGGADGGPGGSWEDATRFTAALQPVVSATGNGLWIAAIAVAALAIALVAVPGRLLTSAVGRLTVPPGSVGGASGSPGALAARRLGSRLTGRNRSAQEFDRAPDVSFGPVARAAVVLGLSAALVTLSGPVFGQPAYLRLYLASAAAIAVVSLAGSALPALIARRVFGIEARACIRPGLLLVSAGAALVSRLADLHPAVVFGLVAGVALAPTAGRAARGLVAIVQALCLLVAGTVGWLLAVVTGGGAGATGDDLVQTVLAEFTTVVALGAIGAAALLLVPVGAAAGRRIMDWSPATWLLIATASFTALALQCVPALLAAAQSGSLVAPVVAAMAFAAVGVSAWLWVRFLRHEE